MIKEYKHKKVLIIGLARTGLAAARLLGRMGARATVTDMKKESDLAEFTDRLPESVEKILGGHDGVTIGDYDLAVISPGVPWDASLPASIRGAGINLVSEIELAFTLLSAPVIAITGTNGKTTTTTLIGLMLEEAGNKTYVGGNIGAPLSDAVDMENDWVVSEVSSFQLEGIKSFRPRIGLILNVTPDHLDRHKTMEAYTALKARLFENQREGDTLILNAEDSAARSLLPDTSVRILRFGVSRHGEDGAWVEDGKAMASIGPLKVALFEVKDLQIPGVHNLENALAASLAAFTAGVNPGQIKKVIRAFRGLPHRMEMVDEVDGVTFLNDSKGTNIDATIKSLSGYNKNVVIIAGGSSKGAGFAPLARAIGAHAKGAVLIGETAPAIVKALGEFAPKKRAQDMDDAVTSARAMCAQGDFVLLSPACASFDMFESYEDRGEKFKEAVARLKGGQLNHAS
ncbi:UDP-N-acetylmuramoylalanine--D-glutamate ligase [hydrothermal vent metagenome]|uniref:UDP-N-acetylmuramoylalanine--D-glutamate ligase n=1 Tax=hydrothermal vent metagenome TaxID=652676 RepID=A0A3B1BMB2_9ZZZZ